MVTPAAVTASTAIQFLFIGETPEFKSLRQIFVHRLLDLVNLLLSTDKSGSDRIVDDFVALGLVIGDLLLGEANALLLFVVEVVAFFEERLVSFLGGFIGHERIDIATEILELRMVENRFAKFPCFFNDVAINRGNRHNIYKAKFPF